MIDLIKKIWCRKEESNLRPTHYECPTGGGQRVKSRVYADRKGLYRPGTVTIWPQLLIVILTGCGEAVTEREEYAESSPTSTTDCPAAYYGDSLADQIRLSEHAPDWDFYAYPGLSLTGLHWKWGDVEVPKGYCRLYVALGTNFPADLQGNPASQELALDHLLEALDAAPSVICVLPMTVKGVIRETPRQMMRDYCVWYIDHLALGFVPGAVDGTHLGDSENIRQYVELLAPQNAIFAGF